MKTSPVTAIRDRPGPRCGWRSLISLVDEPKNGKGEERDEKNPDSADVRPLLGEDDVVPAEGPMLRGRPSSSGRADRRARRRAAPRPRSGSSRSCRRGRTRAGRRRSPGPTATWSQKPYGLEGRRRRSRSAASRNASPTTIVTIAAQSPPPESKSTTKNHDAAARTKTSSGKRNIRKTTAAATTVASSSTSSQNRKPSERMVV